MHPIIAKDDAENGGINMKSYVAERQIRLVGKGWEIREWLRRERRAAGNDAMLLETLERYSFSRKTGDRRSNLRVL
jgi:hypothetical protein